MYKLLLYADDMLLYITDPYNGLPHIMYLFKYSGKLLGYKLYLFPLNKLAKQCAYTQFSIEDELEKLIHSKLIQNTSKI